MREKDLKEEKKKQDLSVKSKDTCNYKMTSNLNQTAEVRFLGERKFSLKSC